MIEGCRLMGKGEMAVAWRCGTGGRLVGGLGFFDAGRCSGWQRGGRVRTSQGERGGDHPAARLLRVPSQ